MTRRETTHILRIFLIVLSVVFILGYSAFRAKNLVTGPKLTVSYPSDGSVIENALVDITGQATNISFLTLNGNKIFTNEKGIFKEKILLSYGYNMITLNAKDRFGRVNTKTIQLVYK